MTIGIGIALAAGLGLVACSKNLPSLGVAALLVFGAAIVLHMRRS